MTVKRLTKNPTSFPRSSVGTKKVLLTLRVRNGITRSVMSTILRPRSGEEVCSHAERGNKENRPADSILTILRPGAASPWKTECLENTVM